MSKLSLILPEIGKPDFTEDPKVNTALTTIETWANGEIDGTNNIKAGGLVAANYKGESIEAAAIKKEAVTDEKVVKGKALVGSEGKWSALVAGGTEGTPSATRPAFVSLAIATGGVSGIAEIEVGGKKMAVANIPAGVIMPVGPIYVPAGQTWKMTVGGGAITGIENAVLVL